MALDSWFHALAQALHACTWPDSVLAAMSVKAFRAPAIFGLCPSSLAARALERGAPRFSSWAVRRSPCKSNFEPEQRRTKQLLKLRTTMDYTGTLPPTRLL